MAETIVVTILAFSILIPITLTLHIAGNKFDEILHAQKLKRNGIFKKRGWFSFSSNLEFVYNAITINVTYLLGKCSRFTIMADLNINNDSYFRIYQTFLIGRIIAENKIDITNQAFDTYFITEGNNERFIRSIITFDIQNKLLEYKSLVPDIRFKNGILRVEAYNINEIKRDNKKLDGLIDITVMFCDKIKRK